MPLPPFLRDGIYNLALPLTNLIFGVSSLFYAPSSFSPHLLSSIEALQKSEEESKMLKMFILKVGLPSATRKAGANVVVIRRSGTTI